MNWTLFVVVGLLVLYVVSEFRVGDLTLREAFTVRPRSDVGRACDGWGEEGGYERDLRYSEGLVDVRGVGVAADFCRAVRREGDAGSLHVACALGQRGGMNRLEYASRTAAEGMRFSRDDYWRSGIEQTQGHSGEKHKERMSYCRILKDDNTGEYYPSCIVPGPTGFKRHEVRDHAPPADIQTLLAAYDGIMTWFRWQDDREDYAGAAALEVYGRPVFPTLLRPTVTRGLQLNRWTVAQQQAGEKAAPLRDYVRWGERGTLALDQAIPPAQVRAIAFWIWWDAFEKGARVLDCSAEGGKDRLWVGIEGGSPVVDATKPVSPTPAQELPASAILAVGQLTEPLRHPIPPPAAVPEAEIFEAGASAATYVFEIWDGEQRIMRLASPQMEARKGVWQHVVLTTTSAADWWPTWQMYVGGELVAERTDGRLSPAVLLTENYVGKNVRGCIQDLRIYRNPMGIERIKEAIAWGAPKLHPQP